MADAFSLTERAVQIAQDEWQRSLDASFAEFSNVFNALKNPLSYLPSIKYPGVPRIFGILVDDGLGAIQSLVRRVAQIPARVLLSLASFAFPLPANFHHRVVPLDDALRMSVKLLIDQGLTVAAGAGVPPGIAIKKTASTWINTWRLWRYFDLAAGLRLIKGRVITFVIHIVGLIFFYLGVIFFGVLIYRFFRFANDPANDKFFKRNALQQLNPLVRDTTLGRKRLRILK
jgi:hypothetical protein